jgi:hypothetical protein
MCGAPLHRTLSTVSWNCSISATFTPAKNPAPRRLSSRRPTPPSSSVARTDCWTTQGTVETAPVVLMQRARMAATAARGRTAALTSGAIDRVHPPLILPSGIEQDREAGRAGRYTKDSRPQAGLSMVIRSIWMSRYRRSRPDILRPGTLWAMPCRRRRPPESRTMTSRAVRRCRPPPRRSRSLGEVGPGRPARQQSAGSRGRAPSDSHQKRPASAWRYFVTPSQLLP